MPRVISSLSEFFMGLNFLSLPAARLVEGTLPWAGIGKVYHSSVQAALQLSQYVQLSERIRLQNSLLAQLVQHFADNNLFFADRLAQYGISAASIQNISEVTRLPVMSKSDLKKVARTRLFSRGIRPERFWLTSTSGSTGEPFVFPNDARFSVPTYANLLRAWGWAGVDPHTSSVSCAGERMASLTPNTIYIKPEELELNWDEFVSKFQIARPTVIRGISLTNFELARMLLEKGVQNVHFSHAFFMGSALPRGIRNFFINEFHTEVYDIYGVQEFGIVAIECEMHEGLHINEESFFVEVVDDTGKRIPDGIRGNIVITSFRNEIVPFIRYSPGDTGMILQDLCRCGRTLRRLVVEGRLDEMMVKPDGTLLFPAHMRHFLDPSITDITRYRITQTSSNRLLFEVALASHSDITKAEKAAASISEYAGTDMEVKLKIVDEIPLGPNGKFQGFVSQLWNERMRKELAQYKT